MTAPFRERLVYDAATGAIFDGPRRYLHLRPDALMGMMRRLPPGVRAQALDALEESILEQGADSARAYRAMEGGDGAALAAIVARTAPDLGWGLWDIAVAPGRVTLRVENSPFAAGFGASGAPVCHPVKGMLRAVAGLAFGRPAAARETACAAMGAPACRFVAWPADEGEPA